MELTYDRVISKFRCWTQLDKQLIGILPKNHAGTVEKLISDFFRMPKKVGAIDSS